MKKAAEILVLFTFILSLSGCFSRPAGTGCRASFSGDAVREVREYVLEKGHEMKGKLYKSTGRQYKGITRQCCGNLSFSISASDESPSALIFDYTVFTEGKTTQLLFSFAEGNTVYSWKMNQTGENGIAGSGKIDPQTYRVIIETCKNTTESNTKSLLLQGLKIALPNINKLLRDNGFSYTYSDFGFSPLIISIKTEQLKQKFLLSAL